MIHQTTVFKCISWITIFVHLNCKGYAQENHLKPKIEPSGQIIEKLGANVTLVCKGTFPVVWNLQEYKNNARLSIGENKNEDSGAQYPYKSTLTIFDLDVEDRREFKCNYRDLPNNIYNSDSIEVYIDDENLLLVGTRPYTPVMARKGTAYTFSECRPMHPDVKVTLSVPGREIKPDSDPKWSYDINKGFKVDPVTPFDHEFYTCAGTRGSQSVFINYFVHVSETDPRVNRPIINSTLANFVPIGGMFTLDCSMETPSDIAFTLNWIQPEEVLNSGRAKIELKDESEPLKEKKRWRAILTVENATKEDNDYDYVCFAVGLGVNFSVNDTVSVFAPGEEFVEIKTSGGDVNISVDAAHDAVWVLDVRGFPKPDNFQWIGPKGDDLIGGSNSKYMVNYQPHKNQVILTIRSVVMQNAGTYQFIAENSIATDKLELNLTVLDFPEVYLTTNRQYFTIGQKYKFKCSAYGYPFPDLKWYFSECDPDELKDCAKYRQFKPSGKAIHDQTPGSPRRTVQETFFNIKQSGNLMCAARNYLGEHSENVQIIAIDFPDPANSGYAIHSLNGGPDIQPIELESPEYICSVSRFNFTDQIRWLYFDIKTDEMKYVEELSGIVVSHKSSNFSYSQSIKFQSITTKADGSYICEVNPLNSEAPLVANLKLSVRKRVRPQIIGTNLNSTIITVSTKWKQTLYCNASGVPEPTVEWLKDNILIQDIPELAKHVVFGKDSIHLDHVNPIYSGVYKCIAKNPLGDDTRYLTVDVIDDRGAPKWVFYVIGLLVLCLVTSFATIAYIQYRRMKIQRWMRKVKLEDFENGDVDKINPEQGIEGQSNLLPYDRKFEFPRDRLKLEMLLGSGAFGQVFRAKATGITPGETETVVAVKMVKPHGDDNHYAALMSEIKIMIHLGQHVNVVNLLGACTKQLVNKRELLVIVEYCKYGSLLAYVQKHHKQFIDQLDKTLDFVDPNICYPIDQCPSPLQSGDNTGRPSANGYHTMRELQIDQFPPGSGPCGDNHRHSADYALSTHVQSVCTDMSYISNSTNAHGDGFYRKNSAASYGGHYRGIYTERDIYPISTTDLLCWCFQIARGMEYLASRNVLHGDLAARNILLAENNVVKICDFGLAKHVYQENYKKKTECPLPIKWMALESICYRVFSTQSDVWSYGVVMWELFTLGKNPYPGMEPDESFYRSLDNGMRMAKPLYAPSKIYDIMCECWDKEPSDRPSFSSISDRIGDLMEEGLKKHYIDLNLPYTSLNQERMEGREDYLQRMLGPDFQSRATPDRTYANVQKPVDFQPPTSSNQLCVPNPQYGYIPEPENYQNLPPQNTDDQRLQRLANNEGYVFMNKAPSTPDIFSPRPEENQNEHSDRFNFDSSSKNDLTKKKDDIPGISNLNYVPNNFFETPLNDVNPGQNQKPYNDPIQEFPDPAFSVDIMDEANESDVRAKNTKRQKNDSGVCSIDSNFDTNFKRTPPPPDIYNDHDPHSSHQNGKIITGIPDTQCSITIL